MRGKPVVFADFADGVNKRVAAYLLNEKEARDALNVQAGARGAIRKRNGHLGFAAPANALTSLFAAQTPTFLIGAGGTKLFSIDAASTVVDITGALVLTSNALFEFVQAPAQGGQGPVYGMNGTQAVQWTGAGNAAAWTAASGTLPVGKFAIYQENRVFVAGMTAYAGVSDPGSTVVFSDLGDPRSWPATNIVEFSPNDGEKITGLGRVGGYVLVFKPSKTWVIYDTDSGANRPLSEDIGCIAHRSIVETSEGAYFLSRDQGVYRTNGSKAERLKDALQPTFDSMIQPNRALAAAGYFRGHYYLSLPISGAGNSLMLDYDADLASWWIHSVPAAQMVTWEPAGEQQLYGAIPGVARVDRFFVPNRTQDAANANFAAYWLSPWYVFDNPAIQKRIRQLFFDGQGRIEVSVGLDFATSLTLEGLADFVSSGDGSFGIDPAGGFGVDDSLLYGGSAQVKQQVVNNLGVARAFSVMFGITSADEMEVESMTFLIGARKD
jgi:hypothetical protein